MNPLPGAIFLDEDFALQTGVIKPMYLMVVCNTPGADQSVLFVLLHPFSELHEDEGPDWQWPERFVVQHFNSPLNTPTEILIDDVYRGNSAILTERCRYLGDFDTLITTEILASLAESPGVAKRYASAIRDVAQRMNPVR